MTLASAPTWAHPRPCGEHPRLAIDPNRGAGSSPPVRGAQGAHAGTGGGAGLIPARAGSTQKSDRWRKLYRAHPRPCGEHDKAYNLWRSETGSSPPVRGALHRTIRVTPPLGLIPARAGSTRKPVAAFQLGGAHPRPCGEHTLEEAKAYRDEGSSPPVRGAQQFCRCRAGLHGLIPARAGSTLYVIFQVFPAGAHPRPCGEHTPAAARIERPTGSSPPVRGAHKIGCTLEKCRGLIPARAGSTIATKFRHWDSRAHPRPCGEHVDDLLFVVVVPGSSPPVRGAPACSAAANPLRGLIPARAGSTFSPCAGGRVCWAHPRPCGEHGC